MAEIKKKHGKMACETCCEPVTVKINERETLSYNCQECDAAPYAKKGTGQHAVWLKKCAANAPAPEPAPAPAPAPKAKPKEHASTGAGLLM